MDAEWCGLMWNMLRFKMWWCEMVVGCRLRCNVMPNVEYGGLRRDVLNVRDVAWNMWYVVCYVECAMVAW